MKEDSAKAIGMPQMGFRHNCQGIITTYFAVVMLG